MKNKEMRFDKMKLEPKNTSEVPKGDEIFYQCTNCLSIVHSTPIDNIGCQCGNVYIDKDYLRLVVREFCQFAVLNQSKIAL